MKVTLHFDLKDPEATMWLERLTAGLTNKQTSNQGFLRRGIRTAYLGLAGLTKQVFNQVKASDEGEATGQENTLEQPQSTKTQSGEKTSQP